LDFVVLLRVSVSVVSFTCTLLLIPRREKGNEKKGDVLYRPIASAEPRKKTRKCLYNTRLAFSVCDSSEKGRASTCRSGRRGCEDTVYSLRLVRLKRGEISTAYPESLVSDKGTR